MCWIILTDKRKIKGNFEVNLKAICSRKVYLEGGGDSLRAGGGVEGEKGV